VDCELCESAKQELENALRAEIVADHELRLAVIRGDGSSTEMRRKLNEATLLRAARILEIAEHQRLH
jgi:hypothetical protein